jgi:hypothetical protein
MAGVNQLSKKKIDFKQKKIEKKSIINELLGGSDMTWACPEHAQDMAGHMRTHMGFIKLKIGPKPTQIQTFWRIKNNQK